MIARGLLLAAVLLTGGVLATFSGVTPAAAAGTNKLVKIQSNDNLWSPYGQSTATIILYKDADDGNSSIDWYTWRAQHFAIPGKAIWGGSNNYRVDHTDSELNLATPGTIVDHQPLSTGAPPPTITIGLNVGYPPSVTYSWSYSGSTTTITDYTQPNIKFRWLHTVNDFNSVVAQSTYNPQPGGAVTVSQNAKTGMNIYFLSCFKNSSGGAQTCPGNQFYIEGIRPGDSSVDSSTTTRAQTTGGQSLGMWTTYYVGGNAVMTGFTPLTMDMGQGTQYQVATADYNPYYFDYWDNNCSGRLRTDTSSGAKTFTSYYRSSSPGGLVINAEQISNCANLGMWTTVYNSQNQVVAQGFTPLTFAGTVGQQYTIVPSDYNQWTFNKWDNGSTTRNRVLTYNGVDTITASYNCAYSCY